MEGIKGNQQEKQLAGQIISKYFKHFPALQDKALNILLDLCEDEDLKVFFQSETVFLNINL